MRRVSSGASICNPGIFTGTNWPFTSTWGKLPREKIRSLTRFETWSIAKSNAGVGIAGLLHRYLWQFDFMWNHRQLNDGERTITAIQAAEGKRLMYKEPLVH